MSVFKLAVSALVAMLIAASGDGCRVLLDNVFDRNVAAALDTLVHGAIAGCIWILVIWLQSNLALSIKNFGLSLAFCLGGEFSGLAVSVGQSFSIVTALVCAALSSALDLDHFVAAGSLRMSSAMNLSSRPFGHSVTFAISVLAFVGGLSARAILPMHFPAVLVVAWGSHQLRDAVRRGLWLWPLGSSPKLPYPAYLSLIALLTWVAAAAVSGNSRTFAPDSTGLAASATQKGRDAAEMA